ncbi:ParB/RepB/Spo0J family partition protein [Parachryseolinea silvisoli]|uniref:ParB/RepB/Spo0J family partition protein n=1 Tax=Parachryseolinea silvisoli TaxID=2873601 RepID=UPI00226593FA|nr:ParB/RepB/Spo0J family partition protein [Parachryseolinea silvisoli]MCD9015213.1 ParB/RepB/Spo0J family partition protein [Parachryseolinea silvisoli]
MRTLSKVKAANGLDRKADRQNNLRNGSKQELVTEETLSKVDLDRISKSTTNYMFRKAKELTKVSLAELVASVRKFGIIQPVLLRPDPDKEGYYKLISGERRFQASVLLGLDTIPAYIRNVSEDEALQMQITENIQRKDVHSLDEAVGYKTLLEKDTTLNTKALASTFGKTQSYIAQRIKLNDLIDEARKDFYEEKMNIAHALMIARLTPEGQRQIVERYSDYEGGYGRVNDLANFIERNVMNCISKAAFDINDPLLYAKAGSCITCPLRSGASPQLFGDISEKDRCFDRACFKIKTENYLATTVTQAIESEPDTIFLQAYRQEPAENIASILAGHKIKVLCEYDDFSTSGQGKKLKGLWVSGDSAGKIQSVVLKRPDKADENDPATQIAKITARIARGKELDQEKVYARVLKSLEGHKTQQNVVDLPLMRSEEALLWYVIYNKAGYSLTRKLDEVLKLDPEDPETFIQTLIALSSEQKAFMLRGVMLDQFGGNYPRSVHAHIIQHIASDYGDIDLAAFNREQLEIQNKREARQLEKIKVLRMQLSEKTETEKKVKQAKAMKTRKGAKNAKQNDKAKVR